MPPLKSIGHVVLVQKTDRGPEIHPGEPLEPADYKKGDVHSAGWSGPQVPCRQVVDLTKALKPDKQSATYCVFLDVKVTLSNLLRRGLPLVDTHNPRI